jgi:hypothetical protein
MLAGFLDVRDACCSSTNKQSWGGESHIFAKAVPCMYTVQALLGLRHYASYIQLHVFCENIQSMAQIARCSTSPSLG